MAYVSNVRLEVGRTGTTEFATVQCRVNYSQIEIELNIPFLVYADLYDRDDGLDIFIAHEADKFAAQQAKGDRDDLIGEIGRRTVSPNGQSFSDIEIRRNFDFGNQESGNEEYLALVSAYPEIRGDTRFSNEVKANLG